MRRPQNLQTVPFSLFPKLFWPTERKNCSSNREKNLKFEAEGQEICKIFDITSTICSNSERSEQSLKQNAFLSCSSLYSAYVAMSTESDGVKIARLLPPNFL